MSKGKKKGTPEWVDKLLNFQQEISPGEYTKLWRRINKASNNRKDEAAWNAEGQKIIEELEHKELALFRSRDFKGGVAEARRAAEVYRSDNGGKIVRRSAGGRFSKTGRTFQVIGGKK